MNKRTCYNCGNDQADDEKPVHSHNRECPVCRGFCKFAKVNSTTPYEEIEAEVKRQQRLKNLVQ